MKYNKMGKKSWFYPNAEAQPVYSTASDERGTKILELSNWGLFVRSFGEIFR